MGHIMTYEGNILDYKNVTKNDIDINDIFRSLPRLNRFVGHSVRPYSVGEHSLYCFLMARKLGYSEREQILTFIHDFTEAYVGDCPAPLKRMLPEFEEIEARVEIAICEYLGIEAPTKEEHEKVKRIDLTMLVLEMKYLTVHDYEEFIDENIYVEMLEDSEFNLEELYPNENSLNIALRYVFNELIGEGNE